ncbi:MULTISPECIES: DUF3134 domain-containing protein [unclassified Anabaena]|uniref:DUF3134 domain-containing protein n=1 Tax=unclassified Anabaena TaxID=2619674 RepID=UPI000835E015|nr:MULTISPECIES: DUF3134 domain-containing protein [unclassified Anabaena]
MVKRSNPPLREEPRYQPAPIIPLKQEESLLEWLQHTGRLVSYPSVDYHYEDEEEEEEYVADLVDEFDFQAEEIEDLED